MPKAFSVATKLDGLMCKEINGKKATRFEHLTGDNPGFSKWLRTWGEAGVVTTKNPVHPKMKPRGTLCMFIEYSKNHSPDTYEMYDPVLNSFHNTRDVTWLKRMYYDPIPKVPGEALPDQTAVAETPVGEQPGAEDIEEPVARTPRVTFDDATPAIMDDEEPVVETVDDDVESICNNATSNSCY